MYIYIILIFSLALLSIVEWKVFDNHKIKAFVLLCFVTILCVLSSLRWDTGQDFFTYIDIYNYIPSIFSGENIFIGYKNIEPGFKLLASFSKIFDDEVVFLFLCCAFSLFPIACGIIKLNKIESFGFFFPLLIYFLVFMINYNFNAMRQAITMGLFVYALSDMYYRKWLKVMVISFVGLLFHSTGGLIFISYLMYFNFKIDFSKHKRLFFIFSPLSVFLIVFNPLSHILQFVGVNVENWREAWGGVEVSSIVFRLMIVFLMIFPLKIYQSSRLAKLLFNFYLYGMLFYFALFDVGMMATRFNMFFRVIEVILVPLIIYHMRYFSNKAFSSIVFVALFIVLFYSTVQVDVNVYKFR